MIENISVKVDDVGRIVIPKKVRKELNINIDDILLLSVKNQKIEMVKRYNSNEIEKLIKKLKLLNEEYDFCTVVTNNEKIVYSNIDDLKDKKVHKDIKKIEVNTISKQEKTILTEDYIINKPHYYCSFYLDIYTKYNLFIICKTKTEEKYAELICKMLNA